MQLELNIFWALVLLILGLYLLFKSADWLVSGAVSVARAIGISPLVIGLTIVAMGTSAPEVAASVASAMTGAGNVAVGNVFGSNIANLALIGGFCAILRPLTVSVLTLKREVPVMLIVALLLMPLILDGNLSRIDGAILIVIFIALLSFTVFTALSNAKKSPDQELAMDQEVNRTDLRASISKSLLLVALGIVTMAIAAKLTVDGGVFIGRFLGLSEAVIGMTIIAIGTSLPELITCIVATLKGHDDISIGNLVGSNVFNTLLVTGLAGVTLPIAIEPRLKGSYFLIMIGVTLLFSFLLFHKKRLTRVKGVLLLVSYFLYLAYIFVSPSILP